MYEKTKEDTNKSTNKCSNFILIGIQFAVLYLFSLMNKYNVTSFSDYAMGEALLNGVDITKKVNNYYIILFALIPIVTILIAKIFKYIFKDENENE